MSLVDSYYRNQYVPQYQQPRPQNNNTFVIVLLIAALVAGAFYIGQQKAGPIAPPAPAPVIVDDNDDNQPAPTPVVDDRPAAEDTLVLRVYDTKVTKNLWLKKQLQASQRFWISWVSQKGMQLKTEDPVTLDGKKNSKITTHIAAAAEKGIKPPFWMHLHNNGDVLSITPFSEDVGEEAWKSIILNSVKE